MSTLNRRHLLAAGTVSLAAAASQTAFAQEKTKQDAASNPSGRKALPTKDGVTALSSAEALQVLIDGNNDFLAANRLNRSRTRVAVSS